MSEVSIEELTEIYERIGKLYHVNMESAEECEEELDELPLAK